MKKTTQNWIEFVTRDLKAAETLLADEYLANAVLFHCQQAVEKVLKAVLEESDIDIPKIHSVIKLYHLLPNDARRSVPIEKEELKAIEAIYIDVRYPGELGTLPSGFPSKARAEEMFEVASRIVSDALKWLGNP